MPIKKAKKTDELTQIQVANDRITLIDLIMTRNDKKNMKWSKKDEQDVVVIKTPNKGVLKIEFPKEFSGDFCLFLDKNGKKYFDEMDHKDKLDITEELIRESVFFDNANPNYFKNGNIASLEKNVDVFNEINDWFKKQGFKKVGFEDKLGYDFEFACFDELTLVMKPSINSYEGVDYSLREYRGIDGYVALNANSAVPKYGVEEKIVPINLKSTCVGNYYPDRNLVIVFPSIFSKIDLKTVASFRDNKFLDKFTNDLEAAFKKAGIKTVDNSDYSMKLIIRDFNKENARRLKESAQQLESVDRDIGSYEEALTSSYQRRTQLKEEVRVLSMVNEDQVDLFSKEIEKLRKIPIVTGVELKDGALYITFKETTIKAPLARTIDGDHTQGPIKEMFIGAITVRITGAGVTTVSCSHPGPSGKPHPHANESGRPCLGSGEGPSTMHRLIGEKKFADFCYVFWMWIKRWRPEDCYIKPYEYYDDRLKKGLPVFDQTGKRIELNDETLIKSGEQIKLDKHASYKKNYPLYKDYKSQK